MTKILKKLIYLILPFLLIAFYTEYNLRQVDNGYARKKIDFEQRLESTKVLILGSSHTFFGVDPDQFSHDTFNMAYVSQSIYYDRMIVEKYLDQMPALKTVVLPISYFSLDTSLALSSEKWRCFFYENYFSFPVENSSTDDLQHFFEPKRYSMIALYGVSKSLKHLRNNFKLNQVLGQQPNGWLKRDKTTEFSHKEGKARVSLHESFMFPGMRSVNLAHLKEIAGKLHDRNVRLLLVTPPAHETYTVNVNPEKYDSMIEATSSFCAENSCEYYNHFDDDRFGDDDFFDRDHLNVSGARKFSLQLDGLLK